VKFPANTGPAFFRLLAAMMLFAGGGLFAQSGETLRPAEVRAPAEAHPSAEGLLFSGSFLPGTLDFSPSFEPFRPVLLADGSEDETITAGKPQWVKDLRRAEIVAFGSFPFTLFFSKTFIDLYRTASHNWDRRYAPWPFKAAGAVAMNDSEVRLLFTVAVSASLIISIADYLIVRHKRNRQDLTEY
jgi:hypothetical protein